MKNKKQKKKIKKNKSSGISRNTGFHNLTVTLSYIQLANNKEKRKRGKTKQIFLEASATSGDIVPETERRGDSRGEPKR